MNKVQGGILFLVVVLLVVGLSGCEELNIGSGNSEETRFVGTWKTTSHDSYYPISGFENVTYIFFSDGTASYSTSGVDFPGTWELKDGKLVAILGMYEVYDYYFSENDTKLILVPISGKIESTVLLKQ